MKRITLTVVLLIFCLEFIFAQMHISTDLRQDAIYNERTKEYDLLGENKDELTFFEFNKGFTMFKHTTPTITSSYIINSSNNDKENNRWEFDIQSDVGNKYTMILDVANDNIRFIYVSDGSVKLVQHHIKKLWFDD
jgi:hypothetical protein